MTFISLGEWFPGANFNILNGATFSLFHSKSHRSHELQCSLISIQTFVSKEIFPVFCDQTKKMWVALQQPSQSMLCCILRLPTSCYMVRISFLCRTLVLWSACEILSLTSLGFHLQCNCNLLIQEWKKKLKWFSPSLSLCISALPSFINTCGHRRDDCFLHEHPLSQGRLSRTLFPALYPSPQITGAGKTGPHPP